MTKYTIPTKTARKPASPFTTFQESFVIPRKDQALALATAQLGARNKAILAIANITNVHVDKANVNVLKLNEPLWDVFIILILLNIYQLLSIGRPSS